MWSGVQSVQSSTAQQRWNLSHHIPATLGQLVKSLTPHNKIIHHAADCSCAWNEVTTVRWPSNSPDIYAIYLLVDFNNIYRIDWASKVSLKSLSIATHDEIDQIAWVRISVCQVCSQWHGKQDWQGPLWFLSGMQRFLKQNVMMHIKHIYQDYSKLLNLSSTCWEFTLQSLDFSKVSLTANTTECAWKLHTGVLNYVMRRERGKGAQWNLCHRIFSQLHVLNVTICAFCTILSEVFTHV